MKNKFDYIIIGSGLAGLTTALTLDSSSEVAIITKKKSTDSSTNLAQGGVAAMLDKNDKISWHVEDTLKAGDHHNDVKAVNLLVKNSREAIFWLKNQGIMFDTVPSLEAGHRLARIVHTSDFTGQDIEKTLLKKISKNNQINVLENTIAINLIIKNNICEGVFVLTNDNKIIPIFSKAVILATGGSGQVYQWTTNPTVATGDGIAIAKRAGADIIDVEFVQFHPTALKYGTSPLFLLSERLRGEGAKIVDKNGKQFISELISRDKLSRAVFEKQKNSEVYLTMAHLNKNEIIRKLPNIYKQLKKFGYDLTCDQVPITPAAHYQCGGVVTDLNGKTSIKNLFAVGEVARTGVHGANRLASNSLLEAVVFGKQVGKYLNKIRNSKFEIQNKKIKSKEIKIFFSQKNKDLLKKIEIDLKKIMWKKVGIVRKRNELKEALIYFKNFKKQVEEMNNIKNFETNELINVKGDIPSYKKLLEINNLIELAITITQAALDRPKSLGAHYMAARTTA